ncbi:MAG TPA: OmpH family outer membrane protein [Steroidobacteraceae bacterium]|nr:OmpH family outer membrane protein [Steroidobacteraceae bacterium]
MSNPQLRNSHSALALPRRVLYLGSLVCIALACLAPARAGAEGGESPLMTWGNALGDKLVKLLPQPGHGLTAANETVFSAFSNDFVGYKGPRAIAQRYPTYVVHQTWIFDDPELERKTEALRAELKARQDAYPQKLEEFRQAHAADRQAAEQAYQRQHAEAQKQMAELQAKMQELIKEGKYDQLGKLGDAPKGLGPFVYPPEEAFHDAYDAKSRELDQDVRNPPHRVVTFEIDTNRTPVSTTGRHAQPAGTLAGHPLFVEHPNYGSGRVWVNLGVLVGPPDLEVSQPPSTPWAVKAITLWADLVTHEDTRAADEARVRQVLESVDYQGLARLITP